MLDMILLGYLADAPRTGYDLKLLIETDGAHFWHAHHSQIYTTLRRLERRGYIRSATRAGRGVQERHVYRLLAPGRDALDRSTEVERDVAGGGALGQRGAQPCLDGRGEER